LRVLVFSDVHGNLPAFEQMLNKEKGIDLYISLGDIVNYGPWSNECVDLLESLPSQKLMGNHEEYFIAGMYGGRSELVQSFFDECFPKFSRIDRIKRYEDQCQTGSFTCKHTINNKYIFLDTVIDVVGNFFIGHSHYQFDKKESMFEVVNVGSVGQNRKEINVICYAIYDVENNSVKLKEQIYDIDLIINKMKDDKYPSQCIEYYQKKSRRRV
jgi:predicted phosphodiesterase